MTTRARKFWVFVMAALLPLIVLMIIFNLMHSSGSSKKQSDQTNQKVQQVATPEDTDWYKVPVRPVTPKDLNFLRKAMLGKSEVESNGISDDQQKAMSAQITSNQITESSNATQSKQAELDNPTLQNPSSPYELQAGGIIPAILITGINSDLAGQITAQVRENVYDSISGNHLLIPQGTKIVGAYDSKIIYGQQRVLVAWQRLIFPNGQSLDLKNMPGEDLSGYAGFNDEVDNHYTKIFGSVVLMSLLGAGAQLTQPQNVSNNPYAGPTVNQMLAQSLGTNIANTGNSITQKNVGIQPTLEIRPGYLFNISVARDVVLESAS